MNSIEILNAIYYICQSYGSGYFFSNYPVKREPGDFFFRKIPGQYPLL